MATLTSIVLGWWNSGSGSTYQLGEYYQVRASLKDENGQPFTQTIDRNFGVFLEKHRRSDGALLSSDWLGNIPDNNGDLGTIFSFASSQTGTFYLVARYGSVNSNHLDLTIVSASINPSISLSPSSLSWGTARDVIVSFNNYMPNNFIDWSFDNVDRTFLNTDSSGHAQATINAGEVSNLSPGSHIIKGTDSATGIVKTATLSITGSIPGTPTLTLTPSTIAENQATDVTVVGAGFIGDTAVSIFYNDQPITGLQNIPVNSNGTFSYVDHVDATGGSAGTNTIKAVGSPSNHEAHATLTISGSSPTPFPFPNPFPNLDPNLVTTAVLVVGGLGLLYVLSREFRGEREIIRDRVRGGN